MARKNFVSTAYKKIFDEDPLLLNEGSQEEYGHEMLRHLLVYRLLTTSNPHPVDLHEKASRDSFLRRDPAVKPVKPPADVADRYVKARKNRTKVPDADFDLLKHVTMVSDGSLTHKRAENTFCNHDEAEKDFAKWNLTDTFNERFRFAAVGLRVKVSRIAGDGYFQEDLCALRDFTDDTITTVNEVPPLNQLGRTNFLSDERLAQWEDTIVEYIETALERKSEIVLLPEFALPSAGSNSHATRSIVERIEEVCKRADVEDHFLMAGTRHEQRYNRGLIFSKRGDKVAPAWWHYKVASARNLGENIMGPFGKNFASYKTGIKFITDEASITVAVCYDTYDPTMFLNIVLQAMDSQMKKVPKIILVPSFNPADDFVALLRDLSFLARCTVIYVNGLHGDATMFVCGFEIEDFSATISPKGVRAASNRLDKIFEAIEKRCDWLLAEIEKENKAEDEARQAVGWIRPTPKAGGIQSPRRTQLQVLRHLQGRLQQYRSGHTLDHIVTIEDCDKCRANAHGVDDNSCHRDILYYNIDVNLIDLLAEFRSVYYLDEKFLPAPLRLTQLDKMLDLIA